jgi:signal recognition particle GTPase
LSASIFLPTLKEKSKTGSQFLLNYILTEIHESLHILLKKLNIKNYSSEATIEYIAQNILRFLVDSDFARELTEAFSDIVIPMELNSYLAEEN